MTHNKFYEIFREYNIRNYCKGTYTPRNSQIKCHFLPQHGDEEVCDTTFLTINSVYDEMEEEELKPNTIFGAYAALSRYFALAVEYGEIDQNPVRFARIIKADI